MQLAAAGFLAHDDFGDEELTELAVISRDLEPAVGNGELRYSVTLGLLLQWFRDGVEGLRTGQHIPTSSAWYSSRNADGPAAAHLPCRGRRSLERGEGP
jgi:hypothetical protein